VTFAQAGAGAKARANYGPNYWKNPAQQQSGNFNSSQSSDSRQSYSYDPSNSGDVAAKGPGCHPKLSNKPIDQSNKQAQKQQSRRSYSQQPSDQSTKSAKSNVAAKGPGCHPKMSSTPVDQSNQQAQNQQNRRSYSQDPSANSGSNNQNWNQGQQAPRETWKYQKSDPRRYQN